VRRDRRRNSHVLEGRSREQTDGGSSTEARVANLMGQSVHCGAPDDGAWRGRFVRESPRRVDPDLAHEVAVRFLEARNNQADQTVRAAYHQLAQQSDAISPD
jgi:hypothetical protein